MVFLARQNLSQDTSHDLSTSGLWKVWYDENRLRCSEWSNALAYLQDQIFPELIICLVAVLDGDESVDSLSGELVGNTNNCCFCNGVVLNKRSFNLGGRKTVTRYIDNIIDTTSDPVVSLVITSSSITSELYGRH